MKQINKASEYSKHGTKLQAGEEQSKKHVYNQENEVYAKLPNKRSREYIYQFLENVNFPIQEIDGVIEKRRNMVDFTCKTRRSAEHLAAALPARKEVTFARVRDSPVVTEGLSLP